MTELILTGVILLSAVSFYVGDQIGKKVNQILTCVEGKSNSIALVPQPTQRQFESRRADTIVIVRIVPSSEFGG